MSAFRPTNTALLVFNKSIQQEWEAQVLANWQPSHPPTPEQQAILDYVSPTGQGFPQSLLLNALAGSGKTNTLFRCLRAIPGAWPTPITSYGRTSCPSIRTTHSLGLATWKEKFPRIEVASNKLRRLATTLGHFRPTANDPPIATSTIPLVEKAKTWGFASEVGKTRFALQEDTTQAWVDLADYFSIPVTPQIIEGARALLAASILQAKTPADHTLPTRGKGTRIAKGAVLLDFADMLYMPVCCGGIFPRFDLVVADEVQDFSDIRLEILSRVISPRGRVLAAGDPHQAIYGFTGANSESIPRLLLHHAAEQLPLTTSFRCSQSVIAQAQKVVPTIQAAPWAPVGEALTGEDLHEPGQPIAISALPRTILCPLNAPLAILALAILRASQRVKILGRETFLRNIRPLVDKASGGNPDLSITTFVTALKAETQRRLLKAPKSAHKTKDSSIAVLALVDGLLTSRGAATTHVSHLLSFIDSLWEPETDTTSSECHQPPSAQQSTFLLSTIHKSKGLEWEKVGILAQGFIGKWAKQRWEQQAALNLLYVGLTRAKHTIVQHIQLEDIEGVHRIKELVTLDEPPADSPTDPE